jgi:SAM-dependent methyltransferase
VKRSLLRLLVCPACQESFRLVVAESADDEVVGGKLVCQGCQATYPIVGAIPRLLPSRLLEEQQRTVAAFGWEWTRFSRLHGTDLDTEQFLDWIAPLSADDVRGKVVLDAGCGMGRFSAACHRLGVQDVVGIDLSRAVEAAYENTRHLPNVHILQADIYNLPFRREGGDFDLVMSIGVLHHVPDPQGGFCALVRHLKAGGTVATWVYGYENNEWLVRYVNPIRLWITSRLPHPLLYVLSFAIACPLHAILKVIYAPVERRPGLGFLRPRLPYKYLTWLSRFGFRHTHHVVFDHLVAPKADYLRRDEFAAWFDRAGLVDRTLTPRNENSWRGQGRKPFAPAT